MSSLERNTDSGSFRGGVFFVLYCFFFSPMLPFLVGQQMELPTRPYLSLQKQLLQNAGARVACCGEALLEGEHHPSAGSAAFSRLVLGPEVGVRPRELRDVQLRGWFGCSEEGKNDRSNLGVKRGFQADILV